MGPNPASTVSPYVQYRGKAYKALGGEGSKPDIIVPHHPPCYQPQYSDSRQNR